MYGESVHRNPDESADMRQQRLYRAVCKGYTKYLKEVEPGRVRRMLRGVVCQQGSAESRKAATRALQSFDGMRKTLRRSSDWNAVYAQGEDMDDASHDDDDDEEMIPVHEEPKRAHEPEEDQAGHQAEPSQRVKA